MDFNAKQNRYLALYQTETETPGYILFNLGAGATIHQSQKTSWQFQVQVNNAPGCRLSVQHEPPEVF